MHRDIKAPNIMLHFPDFIKTCSDIEEVKAQMPDSLDLADWNFVVKLADFGVSKQVEEEADLTQTNIGTPIIKDPESFLGKEYSSKVDLFAFGTLLFKLLTGKHPF